MLLKIWSLLVKGLQSYQPSNFDNDLKAKGFEPGHTGWLGPGPAGRPFLRSPTLTASNFAALWPTDPKFLALKDLNLLKKHTKNQVASSILKVVFAFSKWPHLHRDLLLVYDLNRTPLYLYSPYTEKLWFFVSVNLYMSPVETWCHNLNYYIPDDAQETKDFSHENMTRIRKSPQVFQVYYLFVC